MLPKFRPDPGTDGRRGGRESAEDCSWLFAYIFSSTKGVRVTFDGPSRWKGSGSAHFGISMAVFAGCICTEEIQLVP